MKLNKGLIKFVKKNKISLLIFFSVVAFLSFSFKESIRGLFYKEIPVGTASIIGFGLGGVTFGLIVFGIATFLLLVPRTLSRDVNVKAYDGKHNMTKQLTSTVFLEGKMLALVIGILTIAFITVGASGLLLYLKTIFGDYTIWVVVGFGLLMVRRLF